MKKLTKILAALVGFSIALGNGAMAGKVERDAFTASVTPYNSTKIFRAGEIDLNCKSQGYPKVSIIKNPIHGRVAILKEKEYPAYMKSNPRFKCNNQKLDAIIVYYTTFGDFVGTDKVVIRTVTKGGKVSESTLTIDVKPEPVQ